MVGRFAGGAADQRVAAGDGGPVRGDDRVDERLGQRLRPLPLLDPDGAAEPVLGDGRPADLEHDAVVLFLGGRGHVGGTGEPGA